jgi:hypothetical protein
LGTHEQNPGAVKRNVREGVAVLASYLTLRSAFRQVFIELHTVAFRQERKSKKPFLPSGEIATQAGQTYWRRCALLSLCRWSQSFVIQITDGPRGRCDSLKNLGAAKWKSLLWLRQSESWPSLANKPDFNLEQMIELLDQGLSVETLLDLISWRLEALRRPTVRPAACSSGWIM